MTSVATGGKVYLVGAGPGDPGLITVRGKELIESADAIVYDSPIIRSLLPAGAKETGSPELYFVGKRGGNKRAISQDEINRMLVTLAREGKRVVRLGSGDPLVFGRGGEEALALNDASIPFEIVPGVTAGIAAPAYAGIPVTHRGIAHSVTSEASPNAFTRGSVGGVSFDTGQFTGTKTFALPSTAPEVAPLLLALSSAALVRDLAQGWGVDTDRFRAGLDEELYVRGSTRMVRKSRILDT